MNVDNEELLMSAAFFSGGASVLNTRNKGAIIQMKMPASCPGTGSSMVMKHRPWANDAQEP